MQTNHFRTTSLPQTGRYVTVRHLDKIYRVGFFTRNGRIFFAIEERPALKVKRSYQPGEVVEYSPLEGMGVMFDGEKLVNLLGTAIHPRRWQKTYGFPFIAEGSIVSWSIQAERKSFGRYPITVTQVKVLG